METKKPVAVHDQLLIEPLDGEHTSAGGIIVPATSLQTNVGVGRVVSVGPGRMTIGGALSTCQCKVGDQVFYRVHDAYHVDRGNSPKLVSVTDAAILARVPG